MDILHLQKIEPGKYNVFAECEQVLTSRDRRCLGQVFRKENGEWEIHLAGRNRRWDRYKSRKEAVLRLIDRWYISK